MLIRDRIYAKISPEPNTGCWIWDGAISDTGYGCIAIWVDGKQKTRNVPRLLYEIEKGSIETGFELDHICRNRWCVNPEHLEPVTPRENVMRGIGPRLAAEANWNKTHCPQGHAYSGDNLYSYLSKEGKPWRGCRECRKMNFRRFQEKKKLL